MFQNQQNNYLRTTVQTASPAQLLIMLYDGAIRNSRMAIEAIDLRKPADANRHLIKTQDIISEFIITIDHKSSFSSYLLQLYDYLLFRLREANVKKDKSIVQEVLDFLVEMKEMWVEAARSLVKVGVSSKHA
jgi:flagellar protein FliS